LAHVWGLGRGVTLRGANGDCNHQDKNTISKLQVDSGSNFLLD